MAPVGRLFRFSARVSSDNPPAVKPVLERIVGRRGEIRPIEGGFEIRGS